VWLHLVGKPAMALESRTAAVVVRIVSCSE
jgi:hypothetical protein